MLRRVSAYFVGHCYSGGAYCVRGRCPGALVAVVTVLRLCPITIREACRFVDRYHSHHSAPQGAKFAVGCMDTTSGEIVGVVIVGRPIARLADDGWTAEVTRCCTDGTQHVASKLYAAAWRAARAMGYRRVISYTLADEKGISLVAAGWSVVGEAGGGTWDRPSRSRVDKHPVGQKVLWEMADA